MKEAQGTWKATSWVLFKGMSVADVCAAVPWASLIHILRKTIVCFRELCVRADLFWNQTLNRTAQD